MKFDIVVGNPPYDGGFNPLYMQITKTVYDNVLDENGVMRMINPTALVDNKFEGDSNYNSLKSKYGYLKLIDFYYKKGMRGVFTSASIGNDIAIFTYGKKGELSLFDDEIKIRRFGDEYTFDKEIINTILHKPSVDLKTPGKFYAITDGKEDKRKKRINEIPMGYYCMASVHRGHTDDKTGGHKWDWVTLLNSDNFYAHTSIPNNQWNIFRFDNKKECVKFIKWLNTDFVQYIVDFYKYSLKNPQILLQKIPQPPISDDFSDESLMKEFGLTEDQIKHIHNKMNDYGWKTRDLVKDNKESSLLQFIDDLNNGKVKLPEQKKKDTTDSSQSTSTSLPKTIYGLDPEKLDPSSDIPDDEKYNEEDLIKAYPDQYFF